MKKKSLLSGIRLRIIVVMLALGGASPLNADPHDVRLQIVDEDGLIGENNQAPARPWYIVQDNNILTLSATPVDYVLQLLGEDGIVVYSCFIPSGTTEIILPATLSGEFELRLATGTYYYRGYIAL